MGEPKTLVTIDGWRIQQWDYVGARATAVSKSGVDVDVDETDVNIEWTEKSDDCWGTQTRRVHVPIAVLKALLETPAKGEG